jgi:hypothetical protein
MTGARRNALIQLSTKKTEEIWFASATTSAYKLIQVVPETVLPSAVVRDLGVFYFELDMKSHISRMTRACFYHLRRLRAVRSN